MHAEINPVTIFPAAPSQQAMAHFEASLAFETDCWDVNFALSLPQSDFVLLDVRSAEAYDKGHVPGAIHLPRGKIIASKLAAYPADTLFVTYCAGPHCNGATKAAIASLSSCWNSAGVRLRYSRCASGASLANSSAGTTGRTAALFICPSTNGMASRATNTKMRNTIKIAVSEMRKIPCSASHSAGRARWPR